MARSDNKRMKAFSKRLNEMRKETPAAVKKAEEDTAPKLSSVETPKQKIKADLGNVSFAEAFRAARKNNPGEPFTWRGKSYSTALASEKKAAPKPASKPTAKAEARPAAKAEAKPNVATPAIRPPASLALASKGKNVPAPPRRELDRFNLDKVREVSARMDSKKGTTFGGAFQAKGGSVKKYKDGGPVMESKRKPIDMRRAILGSDKDIVDRANRTPREKMPKEGPKEMPYRRPKLRKAGEMGYKEGGKVMKKATKFGAAMKNKSADAKGRAMTKMACGGKMKGYAKGGSIDGIAMKGKTRCKGAK